MALKNSKKAAQGIGTLIIFIALILVAAVAAGVLIQTASSLQSKSLDVGRQSQEKITTDIEVVQVFAQATNDSEITADGDNLTMVVRLGSGSNPVKLDDLLIRFDTQAGSQSVVANSTGGTGFSAASYGIAYKINGSNHQTGYLSVGDLAEITFTYGGTAVSGHNISEGETATIRLISKNGAVKPVQLTTPSAMTEVLTYLYP